MNPDETLLSGNPGAGHGAGGGPGGVADIDDKVLAEAVRRGLITPSQGSAAREEARSRGISLLGVLRQKGLIDEAAAQDLDEETKEDFVPGYRVLSKLGEGGMGVVYKALQKRLDREVALKVVVPRLASDPSYLKRFEREARAVAKLNHPSIVAAFDYGESNGRVFLAMEFVDGVNLADWVRKNGPMPEDRALAITRDVASGLAHACAAGIIHRDIKPGNILLGGRRAGETAATTTSGAKVTDLGLARIGNQAGLSELTAAGSILGTPGYMPPEQAFGQPVDHRADIYALGATLYQVLTGQRPFEAPTPVAVIARQQSDRLADPRDCVAGISAGTAALLQGMLSREASTRYPAWRDLLSDIDLVKAGGLPTLPVPPEAHRSLAAPTGATPAAAPAPSSAPMAPTLSTPSLGRPVPPTARFPPPSPPAPTVVAAPPASSKAPLFIGGAVLLAAGIVAAVVFSPGKKPEEPTIPPAPAPSPAPEAEEKEVTDDLPITEAKSRFSRIARARRPEALARARNAVEARVEKLLAKGQYADALDLARHVRAEIGEAAAPRLDEFLSILEAGAAAQDARDRNDPVGILAATEPLAGRLASSPELQGLSKLRRWAEEEAPLVTITSDPAGALLLVAGKEIGPAPQSFRERLGQEIAVEARLAGYETARPSYWVSRGEAPNFTVSLKPARAPDPEPAVVLLPDGDPRPLWTGASLGAWSPAGGEWGVSDPSRKARLEGRDQDEPPAVLRGKSAAVGLARLDLGRFTQDAPGWRLEWQMIGEGRATGTVLVEMQFAVLESGTALVLGIDDQAAYLGTRDGASKALTRSHWLAGVPAGARHTFAVEFHGDVFLASVDGKRVGAVAAPRDLPAARTIRAAVEGGAGYFSDLTVARLRKP